jgi:hypothetical protein
MLFATLNARNQSVKSNVQIRDVKCLIAQNALPYAKLLTVLLTAKHQNQNVRLYAKNQNVTGNVINQTALNQNVNLYAKTPTVSLKLNVALVQWEELE